jgi:hypothetical protein
MNNDFDNPSIWRDIAVLIGILPMPRLKPVEFKGRTGDKIVGKTDDEKLEELDGKHIWVRDIHYGILNGYLNYVPIFTDKYILRNCNGSGETKMLHIHDLETIF